MTEPDNVTIAIPQSELARYQRMERALNILITEDCIVDHPRAPLAFGQLSHLATIEFSINGLMEWLEAIHDPGPDGINEAAPTDQETYEAAVKALEGAR